MIEQMLLALKKGGKPKVFVEDVFAVRTHKGTGAPLVVNTGLDMASNGGLVWYKQRTNPSGTLHGGALTVGDGWLMYPHLNVQNTNASNGLYMTSTGYGINTSYNPYNYSGDDYVSWSFKEAKGFFDVLNYTGNGQTYQLLNHNLGTVPGMIITKSKSVAGDWDVICNTDDAGNSVGPFKLNSTAGPFYNDANVFTNYKSKTQFNASTQTGINANDNGVQYVAYLFAHDPSPDGVIRCSSFTVDGNGQAVVNLGWEPQFLMFKGMDAGTAWEMMDTMRGFNETERYFLKADSNSVEGSQDNVTYPIKPTSTGFIFDLSAVAGQYAGKKYVYMAIRRGPMRKPTSGTQVYQPLLYTGDGSDLKKVSTGIPADLITITSRGGGSGTAWIDRVRGRRYTTSNSTDAEVTPSNSTSGAMYTARMDQEGFFMSWANSVYNNNGQPYVVNCLRRYPGVFDIVNYTGIDANQEVKHNLGVVPEMIIARSRTSTANWQTYHKDLGADRSVFVNLTRDPSVSTGVAWGTGPNASTFNPGPAGNTNSAGSKNIAYLFASLDGVSKVGSYIGNGGSLTVDCGFAAGARFVMIKRVDAGSTGDWFVWDTARGIVAANDPYTTFNATYAEITSNDSIDPAAQGFIVNQNGTTNINLNGSKYIFLAFA